MPKEKDLQQNSDMVRPGSPDMLRPGSPAIEPTGVQEEDVPDLRRAIKKFESGDETWRDDYRRWKNWFEKLPEEDQDRVINEMVSRKSGTKQEGNINQAVIDDNLPIDQKAEFELKSVHSLLSNFLAEIENFKSKYPPDVYSQNYIEQKREELKKQFLELFRNRVSNFQAMADQLIEEALKKKHFETKIYYPKDHYEEVAWLLKRREMSDWYADKENAKKIPQEYEEALRFGENVKLQFLEDYGYDILAKHHLLDQAAALRKKIDNVKESRISEETRGFEQKARRFYRLAEILGDEMLDRWISGREVGNAVYRFMSLMNSETKPPLQTIVSEFGGYDSNVDVSFIQNTPPKPQAKRGRKKRGN